MRRLAYRMAVVMCCLGLVACAQQVGDIDRTQANVVEKAQLDGVWYMMDTVTDLPSTTHATFIGETSRTEKIVWVIEEDMLLAYRAYPLVPGTDNVDAAVDYSDPDYTESPVAAFAIESHFNVQREYNAQTGEQSNVIVENTSDLLWFERDFMRVDWSVNLVTNLDFISGWFWTPIETGYYQDSERDEERGVYFELDDDGQLVYFDAPRRLLVEPDWYYCLISSPWFAWDYADCAPTEVEMTSSFARTDRRRDFEPLPYSDIDLARFGYFRSERYVYDRERGVLESTRSRHANIHNLWQQSYRRDRDGALMTDDVGRLVPIPMAEREQRTAPFYLSSAFPDDALVLDAAADTIEQWNAVFREAVSLATGTPEAQVSDVFVMCQNPVAVGDPDDCGERGFSPRPGDLRYNTLHWVESEQLEGPLGYGPVAADPETGEVISSRAYVYGAGMNRYASYGVDVVRFLNDDLDPTELQNAEHVRQQVLARARRNTNLERVSPELERIPLDSRRVREPRRMQARESRRRNLRHFDRNAAMNRLESLRDQGIQRSIAGGEFERALAGRLGRSPNEIERETWDALDPSRWLSPTHLSERRRRHLNAIARGADYPDMIDRHVLGLAESYRGRDDYDQIWREIRAEIFRSTALHEVGHTLGLRHNFAGTYDSLNYPDEYWDLRRSSLFEPENMLDLYELNALTDEQISGRMREYQYSSIMDYGYTFNTDTQGLGKYDRAAIIYGYTAGSQAIPVSDVGGACSGAGRVTDPSDDRRCLVYEPGYVEVFANRRGALGEAGQILSSRDENGNRYEDQTAPNVPYNERWHYTTFMQGFPQLDDAFNRDWMRLNEYLDRTGDGGDSVVRVPYLFCGDEWETALLSCQVFSAGADPFEMTQTIMDQYRTYYYFMNFKRDRLGWDEFSTLFENFYYVFLPLSDYFQNWYLAPEGADEVMDNYYWLSINAGFNLLAEVLATPPYGTYCTSQTGNSLVYLSDESQYNPETGSDFFLNAYCERNPDFIEVPQGEGRRHFTAYDVDSGYNFGFLPLEAGHYWTTLAAFWALTDPEAYVLGTDADLGTFSIGYYDFFDAEVENLVTSVLTENYASYSPRMEANGSIVRYPVPNPVFDFDTGVSFNPETGESTTTLLGPPTPGLGLYEPCEQSTDCLGHTGFLEGTFCEPSGVGDETVCLQDCFDDASLCSEDEECNESGNCIPSNGQFDPVDCGQGNPLGACPTGQTCVGSECVDQWPIVETDATFSIMDDMVWYGMFYTTFGYSTRYNDGLNVFRVGTDETVEAGDGFEMISFTDPVTGEEYGAIAEDCDVDGPTGGSTGLCESCDTSEECAGYTGELGDAFCQPIEDEDDPIWYCLIDCTNGGGSCPDGTTCNQAGNCVPTTDVCDSDLAGACSETYPLGNCPDGLSCVAGTCETTAPPLSTACDFELTRERGAAQMVRRGQELAGRYEETRRAYWEDDGSNENRENRLFAAFSRASFDLENHVAKLNIIRAVYAIFGGVY